MTTIDTIHKLEASVVSSVHNVNDLKELVGLMKLESNETVSLSSLHSLRRTFIHIIEQGHLKPVSSKHEGEAASGKRSKASSDGASASSDTDALSKYREWLKEQFNKFIKNTVRLHPLAVTISLYRLIP
jgi:hypothetical protein